MNKFVQMYLGDTDDAKKFVKQFVEKHSRMQQEVRALVLYYISCHRISVAFYFCQACILYFLSFAIGLMHGLRPVFIELFYLTLITMN